MDLDEFLWREKETGRNFSIRVGCTEQTVLKVKNRIRNAEHPQSYISRMIYKIVLKS